MQADWIYRIQKSTPTAAKKFFQSLSTQGTKILKRCGWRNMAGIIIGFGIVLRLIPYLDNRSLWLDEVWLALNILQKPFSQLMEPLDWRQIAPVGFLFIEKALVLNIGGSEYALRVFPLLAGILSLFLFYGVARRILTPRGLVIALGLFAISELLLRYSSELKQYSSDVTIALGIYLLGLICIEKESRFVLSLLLFSFAGAILIWFSHPAVFSLAGVGIALTLYCLKNQKWQHMAWLSMPASLWLGSFAFNFHFAHLHLSENVKMVKSWSGSTAFMPLAPHSIQNLMWYPKAFLNMFFSPGGFEFYGLAAFCFVIGWVSAFSGKRYACYMVTFPILVTLFASGLHMYPFQGRLILFIVPTMMIFIGEGVDRVMALEKPNGWIVWGSLLVLLFLNPIHKSMSILLNPSRLEREEVRPVLAYLSQNYQTGDKLYLYHSSEAAFLYYAKRFNLEKHPYLLGVASKKNWDNYINELRGLRGNDRVWILFSHVHNSDGINEESFFIHVLDEIGKQIASFKQQGASVYLYNLR